MTAEAVGTTGFLRERSRTRPDLRLVEWRGETAVAKDWSHVHPIMRPHARRCLEREWRALEALAGLPGVPRPLERLPHAIVVSHVEGRPLHGRSLREGQRGPFFDALDGCVAQIHGRGVVHLDLRQRRNILCGPDGQPRVLDFESALVCDPGRLHGRLLLQLGRLVDRLALLKHRARFVARGLSPHERRVVRFARAGRWLWPSTLLHRVRVALRRARQGRGS
jgi:predicted Ser/Thr protein kinase